MQGFLEECLYLVIFDLEGPDGLTQLKYRLEEGGRAPLLPETLLLLAKLPPPAQVLPVLLLVLSLKISILLLLLSLYVIVFYVTASAITIMNVTVDTVPVTFFKIITF